MPKLDMDEALRYAGVGTPVPEDIRREMEAVAEKVTEIPPRYVWRAYTLCREDDGISLEGSGVTLTGTLASKMLSECERAVLFVCTLGERFDALLRREQARDMARAVLLDACGSAWVEAACSDIEAEIGSRFPNLYLTDRFSPGYGDLPLELQPAICAALDAKKRAGVHVTDSLLMNPAKSVSAIIGLSDKPQGARIRGCEYCSIRENCPIRKGGKTCGV